MFDEKTSQAIKSYVYMLIDPKDGTPFYVGKGANNRIFDHVNCAAYLNAKSDKLEKIREIQGRDFHNEVEHVIIRHGLSDNVAVELEAALIETLDKLGYGLLNEQAGHYTQGRGYMKVGDIIRTYKADPMPTVLHDVAIININRNNPRGQNTEAIYRATKEAWVIGGNSRKSVKYVLSEYRGLIVEIFEILNWYQAVEPYTSAKGKTITRWGFDGKVCEDVDIRNLYLNKSVSHLKRKGNANPIRILLGSKNH